MYSVWIECVYGVSVTMEFPLSPVLPGGCLPPGSDNGVWWMGVQAGLAEQGSEWAGPFCFLPHTVEKSWLCGVSTANVRTGT